MNRLPENLIGKIWKGKYRGQKQKWFIVRFIGEENEININTKSRIYRMEMDRYEFVT